MRPWSIRNLIEPRRAWSNSPRSNPVIPGVESVREELGITVSYWSDLDSIKRWKSHAEHQVAQKMGRRKWYSSYKTRVARVERDYGNSD